VTKVLWGGEGFIYTASQDRTIKMWEAKTGVLVHDLLGHGHWVNTLALSTDYVLRTGCFDHFQKEFKKRVLRLSISQQLFFGIRWLKARKLVVVLTITLLQETDFYLG